MKYREVKVGEKYQIGDEMCSPNTGKWSPIPEQWIENGFAHELVGTIGRMNIKIRRPMV